MKKVEIRVVLPGSEALAYSEFLKRVTFGDYFSCAVDKEEAYRMVRAGERIREGLKDKGYSPR